jgi:ABC-type glycerol-3-phosphate transport system substrate-binding protein
MNDRSKKPISRRQFLISGSLLATATLAACAAPAAPAAPAATTAPAADAPAAATEAPAAEPTKAPEVVEPAPEPTVAVASFGAGGTPIVVWHGLGGADGAVFANMLKDYSTKENKAIESQTYDWNVFFQKYPTAVAAGTPPDWSIFHAAEVPQMASQGLMMPMDDMMAANSIPKDDFGKSVMDAVTVDGKTMCVPFDNHGWNCYVNTSLLEGTGFTADNLPKNAEEFVQFALKVTVDEAGKHPDESGFNPDKTKVWALHFSWPRFSMPSTWFQYHGGKGGQYDAVANKAILNSDKSVAAVQYWHDLMYKHRVVPPALPGQPSPADLYKTNSLAVMWEGTWMLQYFKDNPDVEKLTKGVTMNSLSPDGVGGQKIDSHIMSIPTGAKQEQIDRAVPLITWLSNNGKTWATSGQIPARLSVQKDPDVQAIWSVKAASEAFAKQGYTETPHKAFIELQTAWETAVGAALANTTPLKEALDSGNAQIQSVLDRG